NVVAWAVVKAGGCSAHPQQRMPAAARSGTPQTAQSGGHNGRMLERHVAQRLAAWPTSKGASQASQHAGKTQARSTRSQEGSADGGGAAASTWAGVLRQGEARRAHDAEFSVWIAARGARDLLVPDAGRRAAQHDRRLLGTRFEPAGGAA